MKIVKQKQPVPPAKTRTSPYNFLKTMPVSMEECYFVGGTTVQRMRNAVNSHVRRHGGKYIVREAKQGKQTGVNVWRIA